MKTFNVTIKNITASVDKMILPKGETRTVTVKATTDHQAIQKAAKSLFDGCGFWSEGQYGSDGSLIGAIQYGKSLYGRIIVEAPVEA
jgi:hypothetical protein